MESSELALYRALGAVRNYGIMVLVALFALNAAALGTLNWIETNQLRNELVSLSENLPSSGSTDPEQTLNLPEDVLSFRVPSMERTGFYETTIVGKEYLVYANPEKKYILMKSVASLKHEVGNFAIALLTLYIGEAVILIGWWLFVRAKVRELFEIL